MKHALILLLTACMGLALPGCDKEMTLLFVNQTDTARDVVLTGPAEQTGMVGTVGPGRTLATHIKVDDDDMPAHFQWTADDLAGRFTITEETPSPQSIHIAESGRFRRRTEPPSEYQPPGDIEPVDDLVMAGPQR